MKRFGILFLGILVFAFASEREGLGNDIDFLVSDTCCGRGLVNEGIFQAENYIFNELTVLGLKVYKQPVRYKMNIVQNTPCCILNGDTLEAAYDYIPHPFCPSIDREFSTEEIKVFDQKALEKIKDSLSLGSISQVRRHLMETHQKKNRGPLLIFSEECPVIGRQNKQYDLPAFHIRGSLIPDTIKTICVKNDVVFKKVRTHNVIAIIEGNIMPDSVICISAHYDHMGGLGRVYYPGANDNASGVAVLLALARYYAETPPPMTLTFCFFTGEEQGLKGSWKYVKHPVFPLKKVMIALNLDMVGSGLDGYGVVGGKDWPAEASTFEDICEIYHMGKLKLRSNTANSDHFPFTTQGVKALFFYAVGGKQPYHSPDDVPETLDWKTMENTILLVKEYIQQKGIYQGFSR